MDTASRCSADRRGCNYKTGFLNTEVTEFAEGKRRRRITVDADGGRRKIARNWAVRLHWENVSREIDP